MIPVNKMPKHGFLHLFYCYIGLAWLADCSLLFIVEDALMQKHFCIKGCKLLFCSIYEPWDSRRYLALFLFLREGMGDILK